jgi:nucleolar MIF4G domain-containing protein 1
MNESLTDLLFESLVAQVVTPERLIMEHAMLVAVLHANVGTEVGQYLTVAISHSCLKYFYFKLLDGNSHC